MPRLAANLSTLFPELPFEGRLGAAAQAGFRAVECQFPYAMAAEALAREVSNHRLSLVLFNLPPGRWDDGERGIAILPDRRAEFRDGVDRALDYAVRTGCRLLHCLAGVLPADMTRSDAETMFRENLVYAARSAAAQGVRILIEPINPFDVPGYFLTSVEAGVAFLDTIPDAGIGLQYDLYHRARTGGDLVATFERFRSRIAHIQVAGAPHRNEPDRGDPEILAALQALDRLGYPGHVGCEYVPAGDTIDGLAWARPWLEDPR